MLVATQQTAYWTQALTVASFTTDIVALLGIAATIWLARWTRRKALKDQESDRKLRTQRDADERKVVDEAALAQLRTILRSYERTMAMLEAMPSHPVDGQAATASALFQRAFSDDIVRAIPVPLRDQIYFALVKAQETLTVSAQQQEMYGEMFETLTRQGDAMGVTTARLTEANAAVQRLKGTVASEADRTMRGKLELDLEQAQQRFASLQTSPEAYDAAYFAKTHEARGRKLNAIHPTIHDNAEDARRVLAVARAALGDAFRVEDFQPVA